MMSEPIVADTKPIVMNLDPGKYFYCTCGAAKNQPFCDGSHQGTEFTPLSFEIAEQQQVALCACKRTGNAPFCDGSHTKL